MHKSLSQSASPQVEPSQEQRCLPQQNRRLEVHITQGPGGTRQVLLQDLSHGPGVGWYVQKTIRLDREQVDALLRSLCCARHGGSLPCPDAGKGHGSTKAGGTKAGGVKASGPDTGTSGTEARILSIEGLFKG